MTWNIVAITIALYNINQSSPYQNTYLSWENEPTMRHYFLPTIFALCPPLSRKHGDIKSHSSVRPSVCLSVCLSVCPSVCMSVTKSLTLAITFALLQIELWYLACVFFVRRPFWWYHVVTLTVTFDLLQGQICFRAGEHNSLNFLLAYVFTGETHDWNDWSATNQMEYTGLKQNSYLKFICRFLSW